MQLLLVFGRGWEHGLALLRIQLPQHVSFQVAVLRDLGSDGPTQAVHKPLSAHTLLREPEDLFLLVPNLNRILLVIIVVIDIDEVLRSLLSALAQGFLVDDLRRAGRLGKLCQLKHVLHLFAGSRCCVLKGLVALAGRCLGFSRTILEAGRGPLEEGF